MHVEKNIGESIIGTLLDIKGKSQDGINSRKDLEVLGIRKKLHPIDMGSKALLPAAPCTLTGPEKEIFYNRMRNLKVPDGYSSNIGKCFAKENKISSLKSHDYHVLMQQLLSVSLRGLLPKGTRNALLRLCSFYNEICQRVLDKDKLEFIENQVALTLCDLERFFPPFFDIMIHLTIHLAREARICGPVQYRWMYPFER